MAKTPVHHNEPWTKAQVQDLKRLASENTPTRVVAIKLGRSETAVRSAASTFGISLKPTNQSPYGKRK